MKAVKVLYIDLDGTVRKWFDELWKFVNKKEDVEIFPWVITILHSYKRKWWRIVWITNQWWVALWILNFSDLSENIYETNRLTGFSFDKILACTHHPDAKENEFSICWCRKPNIWNVVLWARELNEMYPEEYYPPHIALFVWDRPEDEECAKNANIKFQLAKEWRNNPIF